MSLGSWLKAGNDFASLVLKIVFLIAIALGVFYFGASTWANIIEDRPTIPAMPDINKAPYMVMLKATGDVLLTSEYDSAPSPDSSNDLVYTLHGSYSIVDNKWRYASAELTLNEFYFGDITIKRREK